MKVTDSKTDIIQMVEFLIDNIYVEFGGHVYQQVVGIPMGTNCSYIHMKMIWNIYKRVSSRSKTTSFNLTFRYIEYVYH